MWRWGEEAVESYKELSLALESVDAFIDNDLLVWWRLRSPTTVPRIQSHGQLFMLLSIVYQLDCNADALHLTVSWSLRSLYRTGLAGLCFGGLPWQEGGTSGLMLSNMISNAAGSESFDSRKAFVIHGLVHQTASRSSGNEPTNYQNRHR